MNTVTRKVEHATAIMAMAIALNKSNRDTLGALHQQPYFLRDFGTVFLNLGQRTGTLSASLQIRNSVSFFLDSEALAFRIDSSGSRVEMPEYNPDTDWERIEGFLEARGHIEVIFIEGARPGYHIGNWQQLHERLARHFAHLSSDLTFVII